MFSKTTTISNKDKKEAQIKASKLSDIDVRKRVYIAHLGLKALEEYLTDNKLEFSYDDSFLNNLKLSNDYNIADLTVNNLRIDARIIVDDIYPEMWIPKSHISLGFAPDIYVGIMINQNLNKAELIGFIESREAREFNGNDKYFVINSDELRKISDLKNAITQINHVEKIFFSLDHKKAKELFIPYIDGEISTIEKEFVVRHIASCKTCRKEFYNLFDLNKKLLTVSKLENLFNKDSLTEELIEIPVNENIEPTNETITEAMPEIQDIKTPEKEVDSTQTLIEFAQSANDKNILNLITNLNVSKSINKKVLTVISMIFIIGIASFGLYDMNSQYSSVKKDATQQNAIAQNPQSTTQQPDTSTGKPKNINDIPPLPPQPIQKPAPVIKKQDINEVLASAFVPENTAQIRDISWRVGVSLGENSIFKNYLIITGQEIKRSLSKNLSTVTERALNNRINLSVQLDLKGNIQNLEIIDSSGSTQIDNIVLQTVKNTFNYTKLPHIQTNKPFIKTELSVIL